MAHERLLKKIEKSFWIVNIVYYICIMELLKIDRTKLMTQAAYAEKLGLTRGAVNHMVRDKRVRTVEIKGATLIYLD